MNYLENPGLITRYMNPDPVVHIPSTESIIIKSDSHKNTVSFDVDKGIKIAIIALLGAITLYILSKSFSRKR